MTEASLYFNFLLHIVAADDIVDDAEIEFLETSMTQIGVIDDIKGDIKSKITMLKNGKKLDGLDNLIVEISLSPNPFFVINLVKDAYAIASSNNEIAESELEVLKELVNKLSNNNEKAFDKIIEWVKKTIQVENDGIQLFEKITSGDL